MGVRKGGERWARETIFKYTTESLYNIIDYVVILFLHVANTTE